jgi:hypothetical protein
LITFKKLSSRHAENGQPDQSDADNFSQMIQFNDRKDNHELELSELETFINFQYKKKTTVDNNNGNETSSDDDLSHMFRKQNRLPTIKQVKKRKKIAKGSSAHAIDRKVILGSVLKATTVNPVLNGQLNSYIKREKDIMPLNLKSTNVVNIVPEIKQSL